ncbi:hypothetical protein CCP3SC15_730009 [Gammaproteobacteria bacterium]
MYYLDGNSPEKVNGYGVWCIKTIDNVVISSFYGPASFSMAILACKALNNGAKLENDIEYYQDTSLGKDGKPTRLGIYNSDTQLWVKSIDPLETTSNREEAMSLRNSRMRALSRSIPAPDRGVWVAAPIN